MNPAGDNQPSAKRLRTESGEAIDIPTTTVALISPATNSQTRPISLTISNGNFLALHFSIYQTSYAFALLHYINLQ